MDTYEGTAYEPRSLHKYVYASGNPVDRVDPSGNDDIAEVTEATAEGEKVDGEVAEADAEAVGVNKPRPWTLWDVQCAPGRWFEHEFIWAANVAPPESTGYHVLVPGGPRDMARSRSTATFVPGVVVWGPQPTMAQFGFLPPFEIEYSLPFVQLTNLQYIQWSAIAIGTGIACDISAMQDVLPDGAQGVPFPYRIPDSSCKTWSTAAKAAALAISVEPI